MRRLVAVAVTCLALVGCGSTSGSEPKDDASPAATGMPVEEISEVDQARADAACAGYPAATKRANQVTEDAETGKAYVFLLTAGYNDSVDAIDGLNAPEDTEVGDAIADARDTIDALASKTESYNNKGTLDIGYELEAFRAADDAVKEVC